MAATHVLPSPALPNTPEELERCLADPEWRIFSGVLYRIMVKGDDPDSDVTQMPFKPNRAQRRFIKRLWHRNLILKARQLGFTTLICILWLDHALFNPDQRCGIIAQDRDAAKVLFRDKVKFAYDNLPEELRDRFPLAANNADELVFAHNNSSIRVATSMRSGTLHRLHISEFGKICAKYPDKAKEVMTGSIPAVPTNGILVIESTAEGREGDFADLCDKAEKHHVSKLPHTPKDYRFHFYAWWQEPNYRLKRGTVDISHKWQEYFDGVEQAMGCTIDHEQRAWYVATISADFAGREERMWQEYPSTPAEAFQVSTEGNYYAKDMLALRKRGGICSVPVLDMPVNTFWDIGNSDGCAVWFHQEMRGEDRFVGYYEAHNEDLRHYVAELNKLGFVWGTMFLPHDAAHKRLSDYNRSTKQMLQDLMPGVKFMVVPVISELMTGVYHTRKHLKAAWFDKAGCEEGIRRIDGYRKKYNTTDARFSDIPDKSNGCSEGADALRQWAQAKELGWLNDLSTSPNSTQTGETYNPPPPDWRM
jgi:hypothetical protein